ncbi:uncharacterized protein LOC110726846 [Chenopodium quinoa]|uniref:uncharacterized protein LOC110726846 n=1 Tax=Chenopodium quinoa TaxID=63459 RepID=UPI000B79AFD4|nr:uncharacterized protein LOC110726846 [Chenopodium quinoa]
MGSKEVAIGDDVIVDLKVRIGGVFVNRKVKGKTLCGYEGGWDYWSSSSSEFSDIDINWEAGEEEGDEEDADTYVKSILDEVNASLKGVREESEHEQSCMLESELVTKEVTLQREFTSDSEDLESLRGSDDKTENYPCVEEGASAYGDSKRCRLPKCTCVGGRRCKFRVVARRSLNQDFWQIKGLHLKHNCLRIRSNLNITAEFLAEQYIEDWRSNPSWKLKSFRRRVLGDLGIEITYSKAWMARARVKLLIYGSAAEQYARVWDYGKALMKYNPSTECNVVVDGIDRPEPPLFLRMFICLAHQQRDLCQILVAVGKDGNNNIYPIAWATAEIENTETWVWFFESLMKSLKDENQGLGYTFMSNRQKGLLEALQQVVPYADTRYCVRYIWANFKLQFSGAKFKDLLWPTARATTQCDFEVAMESINFLSEEAYNYLVDIPADHWSRHAFSAFP